MKDFGIKLFLLQKLLERKLQKNRFGFITQLKTPATPAWAKGIVYGALGYFILPIDAIPDLAPVIGYTDDLGVLAAAVAAISAYITKDVRAKAEQKMKDWFGDQEENMIFTL